MPATPFGVDWNELDFDHLRVFFAEPGEEGLTWEAKAGAITPTHVRAAVSAFGNGYLEGFLVLGAAQDGRTQAWTLGGWTPPGEATTWITTCVADGRVDPLPSIEVKAFRDPDGGIVAVVRVMPHPTPPCITSEGRVYQRLPGVTSQVRDAVALRELFMRGERGRARAQEAAGWGLASLYQAPVVQGHQNKVAIGCSSPSLSADVSTMVFREQTRVRVQELLSGDLSAEPAIPQLNRVVGELNQITLSMASSAHNDTEGYSIRVGRHGSVAVAMADPDLDDGLEVLARRDPRFLRMWRAAMTVLGELGAYGPASLAIRARSARRGEVDIGRLTTVGPPTEDEVESVAREASRALGRAVFEP